MANEIRIKTSIEVIQDVGESAGSQAGITYENKQYDGNADSRSWGGQYVLSTTYSDGDVCYWKNAVVSATSNDYMNDSGWTTSSDVSGGSIPNTVYAVAVEYTKALGNPGAVNLIISSEVYAALNVGESIVIPWHAGESPLSVGISNAAYVAGTNEATVNVMLVGV